MIVNSEPMDVLPTVLLVTDFHTSSVYIFIGYIEKGYILEHSLAWPPWLARSVVELIRDILKINLKIGDRTKNYCITITLHRFVVF